MLDATDADKLVRLLARCAPAWNAADLAAAVSAATPCLAEHAPEDGASLAVVFAAAARQAEAMTAPQAAAVLVRFAGLPGYRPDDACVRELLQQALSSPRKLTKQLLYSTLSSAQELGVMPSDAQMQEVAASLSS